jgi:hypothetical protein
MSDLDLKEGQLYLLDGNVLVEASFNDITGLWQLHEPEERSNWMVSPNGKLIGMQFDIARDVWLLDREPDVWAVADLIPASDTTPKLANLLRQAENVAEQEYGGQLTLMRVNTGWKAMYGSPDLETEEGRKRVQALKTFKTLYEVLVTLV